MGLLSNKDDAWIFQSVGSQFNVNISIDVIDETGIALGNSTP